MQTEITPTSYNDLLAEDSSLELIYGWMQLWEEYLGRRKNKQPRIQPMAVKNARYLPDHLRTLPSGLPYRRCLLIHGPCGVGKTVLAKYISSAFGYTPILIDCIDEEDVRIYDHIFGNKQFLLQSLTKQTAKRGQGSRQILILDNIDCFIDQHYQNRILQSLIQYDTKMRTGKLSAFTKRQHPIILLAKDAYAQNIRKFRELSALVSLAAPVVDKIVTVLQKKLVIQAEMSLRSFFSKALLVVGSDIRTLSTILDLIFVQKCMSLDTAINELFQGASSSYINLSRAVATQNYQFLIETHQTCHEDKSDQGLIQFLHINRLNPLERSTRSTAILVGILLFLNYTVDEFEKAMLRLEDHAAEIGLLHKFDMHQIIGNHIYVNFLAAISSVYQWKNPQTHRMLTLAALVQLNTDLLHSPLSLKMHEKIYNSLLYPSPVRLGNLMYIQRQVPETYYNTASPLCLASIGARSFMFATEVLPLAVEIVSFGTPDIGNVLIMPPATRLSTIDVAAITYDAGLSINVSSGAAEEQKNVWKRPGTTSDAAPLRSQFGNDVHGYNFQTPSTAAWEYVYRRIPANGLQVLESMQERLLTSSLTWKTYDDIDSSITELHNLVEDEVAMSSKREAGLLEKGLVYVYNDGATTAVRRPVLYNSL